MRLVSRVLTLLVGAILGALGTLRASESVVEVRDAVEDPTSAGPPAPVHEPRRFGPDLGRAAFESRFGTPPELDESSHVSPDMVRSKVESWQSQWPEFVKVVGLDCGIHPCVANLLVKAEVLARVKGVIRDTWPNAEVGIASQDGENGVFSVSVLPLSDAPARPAEVRFLRRYRTVVEAEWSSRRAMMLEDGAWR